MLRKITRFILFLIIVIPSVALSTWLTDGLGNPLDNRGQPIPQHIIDLSAYIQERTTLNLKQSQQIANVMHAIEKSRSMSGGYLAAIDPDLFNEEHVAWLLINRAEITASEVEPVMNALSAANWLESIGDCPLP